jgi:hypothetical protein
MKITLHNTDAHGLGVSYFGDETPPLLHSLFVPGNGDSEPVEQDALTDYTKGLIVSGALVAKPLPVAE